MRRFRFSLDVLLRLRERREQSARQQVAHSRARCDAAQAAVEGLQLAMVRQDHLVRRALAAAPACGAVDMTFYRDSVDVLRSQLAARGEELRVAQDRAAGDRAALLEAMRRRQAMERLRARRLRAHLALVHRQETAEREESVRCSSQTGMAFRQDFRMRLLSGVPLPGQRPSRFCREVVT